MRHRDQPEGQNRVTSGHGYNVVYANCCAALFNPTSVDTDKPTLSPAGCQVPAFCDVQKEQQLVDP